MRVTPMLFLALMGLFPTVAYATIIKDEPAPEGVPRTGAIIVAVTTFNMPWELTNLTPFIVTNDAEARKLGESLKRKEGVHYIDVITGSEATTSGVRNAFDHAAAEGVARIIYAHRGPGLGDDSGEPCFMLADWDHESPERGCMSASEAATLVAATAPWQFVLVDASFDMTSALGPVLKASTYGPTADTWPGEMPVLSPSKSREYATCNVLWPVFRQILDETPVDAQLTMGQLVTEVTARAPVYAEGRCTESIHPRADGKWFANDVVIPSPLPPAPEVAVAAVPLETALPMPPQSKPSRTVGKDTWVLAGTTVACSAASLVARGKLHALEETMVDDEAKLANYNSQAELSEAAAQRPIYGWTMLSTGACAVGSAIGAGITFAF